MPKPILNTVTITGLDSNTPIIDLLKIAESFPFVEYGILLSHKNQGLHSRYPDYAWIENFLRFKKKNIQTSGHLCGYWVRDICKGGNNFVESQIKIFHFFDRFQLNFHAEPTFVSDNSSFVESLQRLSYCDAQIIFQFDNVNNSLIAAPCAAGIDCAPLFDISGGNGILTEFYPRNIDYAGYAGGLTPDNVTEELEKISQICTPPIWIDVESGVRDDKDQLDLDKVVKFLEKTESWIIS